MQDGWWGRLSRQSRRDRRHLRRAAPRDAKMKRVSGVRTARGHRLSGRQRIRKELAGATVSTLLVISVQMFISDEEGG